MRVHLFGSNERKEGLMKKEKKRELMVEELNKLFCQIKFKKFI